MAAATTSEHGSFIRGFSGLIDSQEPVDTATVRDGVVNNLNHLADVFGQSLVNFVPVSALTFGTPAPTTLYGRFREMPPMSVPLRTRHDGRSYSVVVNLRASISAAGTASFRVLLRPPGLASSAPPDSTRYPWSADITTTSTTGADLDLTPLYLPPSRAGAPLEAFLEVWAKSSVSTSLPRIHSLIAREYIGIAP